MKPQTYSPNLTSSADRTGRFARPNLWGALLAGLLVAQAHSAGAALSFTRGTATTVGSVRFSSTPDSVLVTGAYTGPGAYDASLSIPADRIQYDVINSDQGPMTSWTVYYPATVGPSLIGAFTPIAYITASGASVPQGGFGDMTLFNAGYGVYTYNPGAPWTIDYEVDHVTFTSVAGTPAGLPANAGVGGLAPTSDLPTFAILYSPALGEGLVPAAATINTAVMNGQVYGPLPGNSCISIQCSNIVAYTCSNCVAVTFSATATDNCCSNVTVEYDPPSGTCFPQGSTNVVEVMATDSCNNSARNSFTVTVLPGPNCNTNPCISLTCSNVVAYTCSNCTTVAYTAYAVDNCCPASGPTLVFNPPETTCFPLNSTTPVTVTAVDGCGNTTAPQTFTVTVLPGPNCNTNPCITLTCSNIVAYTCSNCTTVAYNAQAVDNCCPTSGAMLVFNPPETTCFPLNSTTPVTVTAVDGCGNTTAPQTFTVTVLPGPNCNTNPCITLTCSNIVAYTCSNCTLVHYHAKAVDNCCSSGVTLVFNPPEAFCFPINSTTPVMVTAYDACGNTIPPQTFLVTVLPGPNCTGTRPGLSITGSLKPAGSSITVSWPQVSAQLQQSTDLLNWASIAGATNSPVVISNPPPRSFFRLKYN